MNLKRVQFCDLNDEQKKFAFGMLLEQGVHDLLISNVDVELDEDGTVIAVWCLHKAAGLHNETWDFSGKYEDPQTRKHEAKSFEYPIKIFIDRVLKHNQGYQLVRDAKIIEERLKNNPGLAEKVKTSTILYMETVYEVDNQFFLATMGVEWRQDRYVYRLSWVQYTPLIVRVDKVMTDVYYRPN
jgi:hypothetical protein